ncbi:bifunctional protein-serine/threonine kinase/phosphatase [Gilvimarinus agarilyticus]|uniref:bifunctional protein-serine/threonine kinase/phosphatase n=1 Tax=Gilvimarinus sp. 2_MG-2023 TaxID=3062666 RepID=UPI001C088409|nr:bifunctional protein-serine/threonine kinase/phosphatase [Gilvimarinus sp. 2_MG-2023]MBU2885574.1 bifunctional protein-serine/threonine kinase/phosphatase [Gilvimarinus agarilyticus]MDO6570441.1 bifunctional protein-serine/threonine kinase/phosphatase [Gilvimarinus sp. 2_MG-2023]
MPKQLKISLGQYTCAGAKSVNQDAMGACIPKEPLLGYKGVVVAIADGISSSDVSQIASDMAVTSFLTDYYCTSEAWSVKKSAVRVLQATNSWLHGQTYNSPHRYNKDKGYVCTFAALILKSHSAHIFHSGDSRVYRVASGALEQLTQDHRRYESRNNSYLTKALGIHDHVELDYCERDLAVGDIFFLATDGVYEYIETGDVSRAIDEQSDLNAAARALTELALSRGSQDNLSAQLIKIEHLPERQLSEVQQQVTQLRPPPRLQARMEFDGYKILRELYISSRSHVFLAQDMDTQERVVIKTPSQEMRTDPLYLESFLTEDWIAQRIDNAHVLRCVTPTRARQYLYLVSEYIEGQTLTQWMQDHPSPSPVDVRNILEQAIRGVQAFHRQEMLHQDLRPANIMVDNQGMVKIIDFGAVRVAGVQELTQASQKIVGTAQYTAPEYFIQARASQRSDIFALGVIAYQMLSGGHLPYGASVSRAHSVTAQRRLKYTSLLSHRPDLPSWLDETLKRAVAITPLKRYAELSEFALDLQRPNPEFLRQTQRPFIERNPVRFWQGVSLLLLILLLWQWGGDYL